MLGGPLSTKSWLDLRGLPDFDPLDLAKKIARGQVVAVGQIGPSMLSPMLECVANAADTTRLQERCIRDALARMRG